VPRIKETPFKFFRESMPPDPPSKDRLVLSIEQAIYIRKPFMQKAVYAPALIKSTENAFAKTNIHKYRREVATNLKTKQYTEL